MVDLIETTMRVEKYKKRGLMLRKRPASLPHAISDCRCHILTPPLYPIARWHLYTSVVVWTTHTYRGQHVFSLLLVSAMSAPASRPASDTRLEENCLYILLDSGSIIVKGNGRYKFTDSYCTSGVITNFRFGQSWHDIFPKIIIVIFR